MYLNPGNFDTKPIKGDKLAINGFKNFYRRNRSKVLTRVEYKYHEFELTPEETGIKEDYYCWVCECDIAKRYYALRHKGKWLGDVDVCDRQECQEKAMFLFFMLIIPRAWGDDECVQHFFNAL